MRILTVYILLLFASASLAGTTPKDVQQRYGRLLEEKDAPLAFRTIREVFLPLSNALRRARFPDRFLVNNYHIVDSEEFLAFIVQDSQRGQPALKNDIYLSTKTLAYLFSDTDGKISKESINRGQIYLAGILAHEVSHPIDKNDPMGFNRHDDVKPGDRQLMEVRTDFEGALLAEEAGLPRHSVYEFLNHTIKKLNPQNTNLLSRYFGTHPSNETRLTLNRAFLAAQRYQRGKKENASSLPSPRVGLMNEISRFAETKKPPVEDFRKLIQSLEKRLAGEAISDSLRGNTEQDISMFSTRLAKRILATPLTETEIDTLADFQIKVSQSPHSANWMWLQSLPGGDDLVPLTELNRTGILNHPRFKAKVASEINALLESEPTSSFELAAKFAALVPQEELAGPPYFDKVFGEWAKKFARGDEEPSLRRMVHVLGPKAGNSGVQAFFESILSKFDETQVGRFLIYYSNLPTFPSFMTPDPLLLDKSHRWRMQPDEYLRSLPAERIDALGAAAKFFWKHRALTYPIDAYSVETRDWSTIAYLNDLTLEEAAKMMSQSLRDLAAQNPGSDARKALRDPRIKNKEFFWFEERELAIRLDRGLYPHFVSLTNEEIAFKYLVNRPDELRENFKTLVASLGFDRVNRSELDRAYRAGLDILAKMIDTSPDLSETKKTELLKELFLNLKADPFGNPSRSFFNLYGHWFSSKLSLGNLGRVVNTLIKRGLITAPSDLLTHFFRPEQHEDWVSNPDSHREIRRNKEIGENYADNYRKAVRRLSGELTKEIRNITKSDLPLDTRSKKFKALLQKIFSPFNGQFKYELKVGPALELQDAVLEGIGKLQLGILDRLKIHGLLVKDGATADTDRLLNDTLNLLDARKATLKETSEMARIAKENRVVGRDLELRLAIKLLEPSIKQLAGKQVSEHDLARIFAQLHEFAPKASKAKDLWIESLAYDFKIEDLPALEFLESQKSTNWRAASPYMMQNLSTWGAELASTDRATRLDLVDYLLHPDKGFPDTMKAHIFEKFLGDEGLKGTRLDHDQRAELEEKVELAVERTDVMVKNLSPEEKILLVELTLTAGDDPLTASAKYPNHILSRFLNVGAKTEKARSVRAFLASVPEEERALSLAHILTHSGNEISGVKESFEVFGTPGRKAGQASATFKLLPERYLPEVEEFKDNGTPMTKYQIRKTLKEELPPEEYAKIKGVTKVLASASIKTAALIELTDKNKVVALLQAPDAADQTRTHLEFAQNYLEQLKIEGLQSHSALADRAAKGLAAQMDVELDFINEAEQIQRAKDLYDGFNKSMKDQLHGWTFKAPGLVRGFSPTRRLLMVDFADGEAFAKLPQGAEKSHAGKMFLEASLGSMLRHGVVNPDPHARNIKVNVEKKEIYPLDVGQQTALTTSRLPWSADDRWHLAEIIRGTASDDIDRLLKGVAAVVPNREVPDSLRPAFVKLFSEKQPLRARILATLETLAQHDVQIPDRFFFGAAKALLTLAAEQYTSEEEFAKSLETHIAGIYKDKCVLTVSDLIKRKLRRKSDGVLPRASNE